MAAILYEFYPHRTSFALSSLLLLYMSLYFPVYMCTKFSLVLQFVINARKAFLV